MVAPVACPAGDALLVAVREAGGWVHPALFVALQSGERGVRVRSAVSAGKPLAYVPLTYCLSAAADAPAASGLAAQLLQLGGAHSAYLETLPPRAAAARWPLAWSDEALDALAHPQLADATRQERAETLAAAPAGCALQDWLWACIMLRSRTYARPDGRLSLEPLMDLVNHAPFETRHPGSRHRNALHSYVPPGTSSLAHLPAACASGGAAALVTLRPLAPDEEVLVSYRDAQAGGALSAQDSLLRYAFLPDRSDVGCVHAHALSLEDQAAARQALAADVDAAAAAGAPPEALLQAALAVHSRRVAAEAMRLEALCSSSVPGSPAHLAALYRRGRTLAMGRAAIARLPADVAAGEGLRAGVAAAVGCAADADAEAAFLMRALTGTPPPQQALRR